MSGAQNPGSQSSGGGPGRPGLTQLLIDNNIISEAQADLAVADQEITGLSMEEVLILRGWVDRETLYKLAPWLKASAKPEQELLDISTSIGSSYTENVKVYRRLIEKILGRGYE